MIRTMTVCSAALALASGGALATPEGLNIFVDVTLSTADANWGTVNSASFFDETAHTLGGPATLLASISDYATDVLVSSSVSQTGSERTIAIRFDSVTGGTIFRPGVENVLPLEAPAVFYRMAFQMYVVEDPDRVGIVEYEYALLDVNGNHFAANTTFDGFFSGFGYLDTNTPAEEYYGILVNGFEITMTYNIPAPAVSALLSLGLLGARRRR